MPRKLSGRYLKLPLAKIADFDAGEQEWKAVVKPDDPRFVEIKARGGQRINGFRGFRRDTVMQTDSRLPAQEISRGRDEEHFIDSGGGSVVVRSRQSVGG